jgi:cytidylate kinase-like protein
MREPKPVVTLAALYGAGGSVVGPQVAERLGVPFLDRAIPEGVAARAGLSKDAVASVDEAPRRGMDRLLSSLGRASVPTGTPGDAGEHLERQERRLRGYMEEVLAEASVSGGVVLGRGGMVVLREVPWALHVHLRGSRAARLRQATAIEGLDLDAAEQRLEAEDKARIGYVRRAYGVDGEDPALYHVVLDSTALHLDACVEVIVAASRARVSAAELASRSE